EHLPGWFATQTYLQEGKEPISVLWKRFKTVYWSGGAQNPNCKSYNPYLPCEPIFVGVRRALFDSEIDKTTQRSTSLFPRRIILPNEDFVPEDDKLRAEMLRTRVLRGRDF